MTSRKTTVVVTRSQASTLATLTRRHALALRPPYVIAPDASSVLIVDDKDPHAAVVDGWWFSMRVLVLPDGTTHT